MVRIVSHIEELLYENDCVIIPGIGGFVLYSQHAIYDQEKHIIKPEFKEVRFNEQLTHDDGLLIQSYSNRYGISYAVGKRMVEGDVEDLIKMLKTHTPFSLGSIGNLTLNAHGHYEFEPSKAENFSPDSFGLSTLSLTPLSELTKTTTLPEVVKPKRNPNVIYIPIHLNVLRGAAAMLAMIVMFFIMTTNVEEVDRSAYKAGFVVESSYYQILKSTPQPAYIDVKPENSSKSELENVIQPQSDSTLEEKISEDLVTDTETERASELDVPQIEKKESIANVEDVKKASESIEKPQTKSKDVVDQSSKGPFYYVVVASLVSKNQAEQYIREQKEFASDQLGVLHVNGKYRVYSARFTDKSSAVKEMDQLRNLKGFDKTWVFTYRH